MSAASVMRTREAAPINYSTERARRATQLSVCGFRRRPTRLLTFGPSDGLLRHVDDRLTEQLRHSRQRSQQVFDPYGDLAAVDGDVVGPGLGVLPSQHRQREQDGPPRHDWVKGVGVRADGREDVPVVQAVLGAVGERIDGSLVRAVPERLDLTTLARDLDQVAAGVVEDRRGGRTHLQRLLGKP
jgi:hypothetical protein